MEDERSQARGINRSLLEDLSTVTLRGKPGRDRRLLTGLSFLLILLPLSACGHRQDIMKPVTVAEPTTGRVDMLVATTREPAADPARRYTGERGETVRLDNIIVSIPPEKMRQSGQVQWPSYGKPDAKTEFLTVKAEPLADKDITPWFKRTSGPKRRVLVFVHGFNNSYSDAVYRFAQIAHDMHMDAAPVLFTWPSRGNVLDYVYDRESTIYSRFGLATVLDEAVKSPDVADVTILAHSMGTWLTMEVLREIAFRKGKVSPKIKTVVLASPDIDVDVFRRQVLEIGPQRPHITIFSSRNDLALTLSTFLAGDVQRLGVTDFKPYEKLLEEQKISVIDASDVQQTSFLGHSTFAESSDMLKAVTNRLADQELEAEAPLLPGAGLLQIGYRIVSRR